MASTALRFGVSQFTTRPWSFDEDVARYGALGIDAIEVVEAKLDADRWAEQMASIELAGLAISGVQPEVRTFLGSRMMPEPAAIDARVACMRRTIERLGRYAPGAPFITNTGAHPDGNVAETIQIVADRLGELARVAADHGVSVALEPLNPSSVNVESMVWTIQQALEIIDRVGREEVGLCLDYWNIWGDAEVENWIGRAGSRIMTVQVSDWRAPRSFADRITPGDGIIPLTTLIAATRRTSYNGPYVLEIFSDDVDDMLYDADLDDVILRSRMAVSAAWQD